VQGTTDCKRGRELGVTEKVNRGKVEVVGGGKHFGQLHKRYEVWGRGCGIGQTRKKRNKRKGGVIR